MLYAGSEVDGQVEEQTEADACEVIAPTNPSVPNNTMRMLSVEQPAVTGSTTTTAR